ncbi:MAG TPA: HlyD family secretion protein [Acidisarcina sp.]|nr:HlyD family secretion protein [Acidisarcina sp.]
MAEQNLELGEKTNAEMDEIPEAPEPRPRHHFIIFGVVVALVVGALLFWWHSTFYEDTDDAQVSGHLVQISSRISGQIVKVNVEENQYVEAGTVVAEIDPRDFEVAVKQNDANLQAAEASSQAAQVNVPIIGVNTGSTLTSAGADVRSTSAGVIQAQRQLEAAHARVEQARANNEKAQLDLKRYAPLVEKDVISRQQFDAAVAAAASAKAAVADALATELAADQGVRMARQRLDQSQAQLKTAQTGPQQVAIQRARANQASAEAQRASAALEQAKLNLSYTRIVAPISGIITRKSVELGQNVSSGQNLMTLVSLDDVWITANFKETQLRHMKQGQPVEIKVDAYGRKYDGVVTQIGGATGSVMSLFPPENATGNYVKVVQRVPVRIDLKNPNDNKDHLLRPGLSVVPSVRVKQ